MRTDIIIMGAFVLGALAWPVTAVVDSAICPWRSNNELDRLESVVHQALPQAKVEDRVVQCGADPMLYAYVTGDLRRSEVLEAFKDAGWTTDAPQGQSLLSPDGKASMHMGGTAADMGGSLPGTNEVRGLPASEALFWVRPEPYEWPEGDGPSD